MEEDFLVGDFLVVVVDLVVPVSLDLLEGDLLEVEEEVDLVFFMGEIVVVGGGFVGVVEAVVPAAAAAAAVVLLVAAAMMLLVGGDNDVFIVMVSRGEADTQDVIREYGIRHDHDHSVLLGREAVGGSNHDDGRNTRL